MKKGNSRKAGRNNRATILKKCFTLWVLASFILSMNPVYANRANELGVNPGNLRAWSPYFGRDGGGVRGASPNTHSTKNPDILPPPIFVEPIVPMPKEPRFNNNNRANDIIPKSGNDVEKPKFLNPRNIGDIGKPLPGVDYPGNHPGGDGPSNPGDDCKGHHHHHNGHNWNHDDHNWHHNNVLSNSNKAARVQLQTKTLQTLDTGNLKNVNRAVDLDLTSGQGNISLGSKLFEEGGQTSVTLNVGGEQKTFAAGDKATAAEYASILQVLGGGTQSLSLDKQGRATGGDMTFESLTANGNVRASSLVIPEAVQVTGNFAKNSEFKLRGDLTNYGSIYALSNREGANKAVIAAHDLTNESGGLISSYSNSSLGSDLISSVDLKLRAEDTLTNQGRIESSGDLTLSAATIVNGTNRGHQQSTASVSAANNVFLDAAQINNAGSIVAQSGDVNIDTLASNLTVNSTGGSVQALNGAINIRNAAETAKVDTTLTGGDWLSKDMNAYSGDGTLNMTVGELTGALSVKAGIAHIAAETETLNMVGLATTGDPTIKNVGNVNLSGNNTTGGNPLAILATQDIILAAGTTIDTTSATNGGNIVMVAGSNWTPSGLNNSITGASGTGGNIFLNSGDVATITSNGTGAGSAGSIQLIAFSDAAGAAGDIFMDATSITAQGGNGGNNGNVTAIGRGIFINSINARGAGSVANTGNISLSSFQPQVVGGAVLINDANGNIVSGSFTDSNTNLVPTDVNIGAISAGGNLAIRSSQAVVLNSTVLTRAASVTAKTGIFLDGNAGITAPGGIALVAGTDIGNFTGNNNANFLDASSTTTNAGNITVVAGATFTETAGTITVTGGSATGGFIGFSFIPFNRLTAASTNGNGGNVVLTAFRGTGGGDIQYTSGTAIATGGSGANSNGNVTIVAGNVTGGFTTVSAINTSGGAAGTGDITISNSTPVVAPNVQINKTTGGITAGNFAGGAFTGAGLGITGTLTAGDDITIESGSTVDFNSNSVIGNVNTAFNIIAHGSVLLGPVSTNSLSVSATDNINLLGDITTPAGLTLVSSHDILPLAPNVDISTASATGPGGDIVIVAGAAFSQTATAITITGASTTGGGINFDFGNLGAINTRSTALNGAGGDILMVAFTGTDNTGFVFTDGITSNITTGGSGTGANGNLTAIAGQTGNVSGIGIRGLVNTTGGSAAGTGNVFLATATPNTSTSVIVQRANASITQGNFVGGTQTDSNAFTDSITVNNASIDIQTGGFSTNGTFTGSTGSTLNIQAGNSLDLVTATVRSVALVAGTDLNLNGDITAPTGIVMVAGHNIFGNAPGIDISSASAAGSGGNITMVAGATFSQTGTTVTITGASSTGGRIDLDFNNVLTLTTRSTGGGGNGGALTLAAFTGSDNTGNIFIDTATTAQTGGNGGGSNGNFVAVSGATQFNGVFIGGINTTGGAAGTGTVYVANSTPDVTPAVIISKTTGGVTTGDFTTSNAPTASDLTTGLITVNNATVTAVSGGAITLGSVATASTLSVTAGTNINLATVTAGTLRSASGLDTVFNAPVTLTGSFVATAGRDIAIFNDIVTPAGILMVAGNDISTFAAGVDLVTATSGAAGDITIVAGAAFSQNGTSVTVTGASATGGFIDFDNQALSSLDSRSTGGGGAGGNITLIAFTGTDTTGFVFTDPGDTIRTGGNGAGNNGTLTIIANQNGGNGVGARGTINTTGGAAGTGDVWIASALPVTTTPVVINKSSAAITAGDFRNGAAANNTIFTDNITVANALITVNSGAGIVANNFTGFSTLSMTSVGTTQFNSVSGANLRVAAGTSFTSNSTATLTGSYVVTAGLDINLNNDVTAVGGITMVAGRDVIANTGGVIDISTASAVASANDITIVAGAAFSQNGTTVTVSGPSATGGRIDFDAFIVNSITTRSTFAGGSGGDLTLAAFVGTANTGNVFTDPTTILTTGGTGAGANGNFVAVAGATQFIGVGIGNVNTTGGAAGTGSVYIADAAPNTTPSVVIQKSNASITTGNFRNGAPSASDMTVGNITVNATTVDLISGGAITVGNITGVTTLTTSSGTNSSLGTISGGSQFSSAGLDIVLNSTVTLTGSFSAVAGRDIILNNDVTSPGGMTMVAGNDIRTGTLGVDLSTAVASGAAGDMTLVAGAAFSQNAGTVTITGASATGGAIDFDFVDYNSINTRSNGGGGAGGDVNMIAFAGTDNTGYVFLAPTGTINTGGNGAGSNGTFTAIANQNTGNGLGIVGTLNTTGGASGTGDVWIASALPNTTTSVVVSKNTGSITAGDFRNGALANNTVFTGNITVANANITVSSGAGINSNNFTGFNTLTLTSVGDAQYNIATGTALRAAIGQDFTMLNTTTLTGGSYVATAGRDIILNNDVIASGGILMVAGRDVFANTGGVIDISTANASGSANDISIIAGAAFSQNGTSVTVTGGSATGGSVNFDSFSVNSLDARSTGGGGSGGDILLVAFNGAPDKGAVLTDTATTIRTGGNGAGTNGTITAIAGGTGTGFGLGVLGTLNTTGGAAGTGDVWLAGATPVTAPNVVLSKANASVTSGDFRNGAVTPKDAFVGNIIVNGADVTIQTGGQANVGAITGTATTLLDLRAGAGVVLNADIAVGNTSITAGDFVTYRNITSPGGILIVAGSDILAGAANVSLSSASNTGNAGSIALVAGAAFTQTATTVTVTGASATGGFVGLDAPITSNVNASSTFAGGAGGNITIAAFRGSNNTGSIFSDATTNINASGFTTGSNGNIIMVSGSTQGFNGGIFLGGNINLTGQQGTGLVSLNTTTPSVPTTLSKTTANVTVGDFRGGAAVNSDIVTGNITVRGGTVVINSGHDVAIGAINVSGNGVGAGGSIQVTTRSTNAVDLGGTFGTSFVTSLNANGGATSGNAGSINVLATGTGGIFVDALGPVTATEGNGGQIILTATTGDIDIDTTLASLRANAGTVSATAHSGGTVSLQANAITANGGIDLQANGVAGGAGGTVSVTTNNSTINVGTAAGQINAQANGPGGTITLQANGGGNVNETATGNLTASTVNIGSATGNLILNGIVNGSTAVNLTVTGTHTITGTGPIQGGTLTINAGTAATSLTTNVTALTLNTTGNVTITEANALNVNASNIGAGLFTLTSTGGGNIAFLGAFTANGGFNITTSGAGTITGAGVLSSTGQLGVHAGAGTIDLDTNVASLNATGTGLVQIDEANGIILNGISANTFNLSAGSISQGTGFIAANTIDLNATAGDIGAAPTPVEVNNGANPVNLTADATGDIYIHIAGTGLLNWGTSTATNIFMDANGPITTTGDITATNVLDITTNYLTNANDLTATTINIQSQAGSGLTIDGGAGGGTMNATNTINITATGGNLTFIGNQDFFGDTFLDAQPPGNSLIISAGANVIGHDTVTVLAGNTVLTGNLQGNPLIFANNFFTIINTVGNVNLAGNVILQGQAFAILASGNINTTGMTTINLSDPTGAGSNLLLVAGFNFSPPTIGQTSSSTPYTIGSKSTTGGNINLGTVNINLSGGAGNGGLLTAVAGAGTTNAGTIALGNINTSATGGTGGRVQIIGEGGVTTGSIDTRGTVADNTVQISVATPTITGGAITVTDGVQGGPGSFTAGTTHTGNIQLGTVNAGSSTVTLLGALGAADTITQTAASQLNAATLNVIIGAGSTNINTGIATLNATATGAGTVGVTNTGNLQLGILTGAGLGLDVTASGRLFTPAAGISGIRTVDLTGSAGVGVDAIVITGPISTSADIILTANGGSALNLTTNLTAGNLIALNSTAGDVNVAATSTVTAPTVLLNANQTLVIAGNINAQTLALTSAISIQNNTFTGNLGNPTSLFLTSLGGDIGSLATPFTTSVSTFSATALGGDVFINATNTGGIVLLDSGAAGSFTFTSAGPTTLNDILTGLNGGPGGDINIQKNGVGTIAIAAGANITTVEGDVLINNADINKKTGFITIGDGVNIKGSGTTAGVGEVFITLGGIPATFTHRKLPKKAGQIIETGGAQVFLGKKNVFVQKKTGIVLSALGRNLVFSTDKKQTRKNITLGNNVHITADPPGDIVAMTAVKVGPKVKTSPVSTRALATTAAAMTLVTSPPPTLAAVTTADQKLEANVSFNSVLPQSNSQGSGAFQKTTVLGTYSSDNNPMLVNMANQVGLNFSAGNISGPINPSTFEAANFDVTNLHTTNFTSTIDAPGIATSNLNSMNLDDYAIVDTAKPLSSIVLTQTTGPISDDDDMMEALFNDSDDDDSVIDTAMRRPEAINARLVSNDVPEANHKLESGCALYTPAQKMTVETPHAKVAIDRGSVVLVVTGKQGVAVFDLHDGRKSAVQIITPDKTLSLSPGVHISYCPKSSNVFADSNLADAIAHRGVQCACTKSGGSVFTSEFSIPSAIDAVQTIKQIIYSPNPEHVSLSKQMMKTLAVLQYVSPGRGQFELHVRRPQMTATGSQYGGQL